MLIIFAVDEWFIVLCLQAEEQLKLVEDQRQILEERQRLEDTERTRVRQEQDVILNKKNARPRLSFSLGKTSWEHSRTE